MIKTIINPIEEKLLVKKSAFYSHILPINELDELKYILSTIKKNHKQANHIAFAYHITKLDNKNKIIEEFRYNDDGEPSKTAGFPLLRILQQEKLTNTIILVARVFGGIKLGTSGLTKAYGDSARQALKQAKFVETELTKEVKIKTTIQKFSNIEIFLKQRKLNYNYDFQGEDVIISVNVPINMIELEEELISFM